MPEYGVWIEAVSEWLVSGSGSIVHSTDPAVMVAELRRWVGATGHVMQFGPDGLPVGEHLEPVADALHR